MKERDSFNPFTQMFVIKAKRFVYLQAKFNFTPPGGPWVYHLEFGFGKP